MTGGLIVSEIENHPWFVGTQYHPEYQSTVESPSPLFVSFVRAALDHAEATSTVKQEKK